MRKYQCIWQEIKSTGLCKVAAHPALHKRIKKAVTKEKYIDNAYKLQWDIEDVEQPELKVRLDKDNKNILIFTLEKPITLGDL